MSAKTTVARLTSRERLTRGLKYSAVGPLDVTRGALGVSVHTVGSSAGWLRDRCRSGGARRPRPLVLAAAAVVVLAVGAVSFSIIRRSTRPDPSTLPPSVDVTPRP